MHVSRSSVGAPRSDVLRPQSGVFLAGSCHLLLLIGVFLVWPLFFDNWRAAALAKVHLSAPMALLYVLGLALGSLVNVPLWRWERGEDQALPRDNLSLALGWVPLAERHVTQTILAVNVGGGLVAVLLAIYLLTIIVGAEARAPLALLIACAVNSALCYRLAKPTTGLGMMQPVFVSPLVSVGLAWLLLAGPEFELLRGPVAMVTGVAGPLIGGELLHWRDYPRISAQTISLGGAGTIHAIALALFLAVALT